MQKTCPNFNNILKLLAISSLIVIYFFVFISTSKAATGINRQINFQGKLVNINGTNVTNGNYTIVFSLYGFEDGAQPAVWTESQSIAVVDGIFQASLGSVTPIPANFNFNWDGLYLGIKVGADNEMAPRIRMSAVPFAFNAEKVAGLTVQDENGAASTSGILKVPNGKTIAFAGATSFGSGTTGLITLGSNSDTLAFTTAGATSLSLPTGGTLLTNTVAANQTITSTQTSGTLFSLADSSGPSSALTALSIGLTGTSNSQNKTGISFDLSGGTGGTYYDLYGTGGDWSMTRAGALHVASCDNCGGGPGGSQFWQELAGALSPSNINADFLLGATATSSAQFSISGINNNQAIASLSGNMIIMPNNGWGGMVGIGTTSPLEKLDVGGALRVKGVSTTAGIQMTLDVNDTEGLYIQGITDTNNLSTYNQHAAKWLINGNGQIFQTSPATDIGSARTWTTRLMIPAGLGTGTAGDVGIGGAITANDLTGAVLVVKGTGNVGIGTTTPGNPLQINSGTTPAASQFRATANGLGGFSILVYSADNIQQGYDVDWSGSVWTARDTSAARISKIAGKLAFSGDAGLTVGNDFTPTDRMTIDLSTGNVGIGTTSPSSNLEVLSATTSVASVSATTTGNGLTFTGNSGAIIQSLINGMLTIGGNTTGNITLSPGSGSGTVTIGNGTNGLTFDVTNGGPTYAGTARPTRKITLSPEYAGAVLTPYYGTGTDTNITGDMTSDTDTTQGTSIRNYYQWLRTTDATQHYYTVAVRVTLPSDFSVWATSNALQVTYRTQSATNTVSDLDVNVYNENSSTIVASSTGNASTSWTTVTIDDSVLDDGASSEWHASGETVVIYLRMGSASSNYVQIGDIVLNYLSKF